MVNHLKDIKNINQIYSSDLNEVLVKDTILKSV